MRSLSHVREATGDYDGSASGEPSTEGTGGRGRNTLPPQLPNPKPKPEPKQKKPKTDDQLARAVLWNLQCVVGLGCCMCIFMFTLLDKIVAVHFNLQGHCESQCEPA